MHHKQSFFSRVFKEGLLLVMPLGITLGLIYWAWSFLRDFVPKNLIDSFMSDSFKKLPYSHTLADLIFFLIVIVTILFVGMIASTIIGRIVHFLFEKIMLSPTFIRPIYQTFKKISEMAFKNEDDSSFTQNLSKSVVIPYPNRNSKSIGFVTNESAEFLLGEKGKDWVTVYVPSAPLVTAGFFILCKKSDLEKCHLSGAQALSTVISVGTTSNDLALPDINIKPVKKVNIFRIWFLNGLLLLTPVAGTLSILGWLFKYLYKGLGSINSLIPVIQGIPANIYDMTINFFLLLIIILLIIFIGLIGESTIGTWIRNSFNRFLNSIPMINTVYDMVRKIIIMFSPDPSKDSKFNQAVLIPYPTDATYAIGFITGKDSSKIKENGQNEIPIFIPTTPIPTTGWFVFANKDQMIPLNMSIEKAFGLVISAGVLSENQQS